jgi:hypothetical protein
VERISTNLEFATRTAGARLDRGRFIDEEWMRDWAESYGRDQESVGAETAGVEDLVIDFKGVRAYAMANHNQFVAPKEAILSCLPEAWSGRLMGEMDELDVAVNQAGYLRLTTIHRTTQHLGNVVSPSVALRLGISPDHRPTGRSRLTSWRQLKRRILRTKQVRWFLLGLYSRLFGLLNPE